MRVQEQRIQKRLAATLNQTQQQGWEELERDGYDVLEFLGETGESTDFEWVMNFRVGDPPPTAEAILQSREIRRMRERSGN
jgi:hypothetical protein